MSVHIKGKKTHKLKSLENKTTLNIVNVSYSFTQFSTIAKTYTTNGTRTVYISQKLCVQTVEEQMKKR